MPKPREFRFVKHCLIDPSGARLNALCNLNCPKGSETQLRVPTLIGSVTAIAHGDPPTPPDMRFSASGD
jgi:hypothetical protein